MKNKTCKHGSKGEICCKCQYGELSHIDHKEKYYDLMDELNLSIGYKLVKGFNLLKEDE